MAFRKFNQKEMDWMDQIIWASGASLKTENKSLSDIVYFSKPKKLLKDIFERRSLFWAEGFLGDTIFWSFSSIIKSFEDLKKIENQIKLSIRRKSAVSGFPSLYSFFLFFRDAELFRCILSFVSKHLTVSSKCKSTFAWAFIVYFKASYF